MAAKTFFGDLNMQGNEIIEAVIETQGAVGSIDSTPTDGQLVFFDNTTPSADVGGNEWSFGENAYVRLSGGWKALITSALVDGDAAATAGLIPLRDSNGDIYVPTTPTAANSAASKSYVDSQISSVTGGINIRGAITATITGTADLDFPVGDASTYTATGTNYSGAAQTGDGSDAGPAIAAGDSWYFNTATAQTVTIGGADEVTQGDLIIAINDTPSTAADWLILENANEYATDTTAGIIELATQGEVDAGTDTERAVTPATLDGYIGAKNYGQVYTQTITTVGGETTAIPVAAGQSLTNIVSLQLFDGTTNIPIVVDISSITYDGANDEIDVAWTATPNVAASSYWAVTMVEV